MIQRHAAACLERQIHRVSVDGLNADDFDVRAEALYIGGDAGNQAAAADGDKYCVDVARASGARSPWLSSPCPAMTSGSSYG